MADWTSLKSAIAQYIKQNGEADITGDILQNVLINIVSNLGFNATFAGIAHPTTNPGSQDGPVFYFAFEDGTYNNFGGIVIENEVCILSRKLDKTTDEWVKMDTGLATATLAVELKDYFRRVEEKLDAFIRENPDSPLTIRVATKLIAGIVQIGDNIDVNGSGVISVPIASYVKAGLIRLSEDFEIDENGVVTIVGGTSGGRIATPSTPGIVMPGDDFDINTETGLLTLYKALTITSWSIAPSIVESGSTITEVIGTYANSKVPVESKAGPANNLSDVSPALAGTISITGSFTDDTTFHYKAKDAKQQSLLDKYAALTFGKYYYKTEDDTPSVNPTGTTIQQWSKALTTTAARTVTMSAQKYLYYAVPKTWAVNGYKIGGFDYTFVEVNSDLSVQTSNNTTAYKVLRTASKIDANAQVQIY